MESLRILIADDHTFYREGVRAMLALMPNAEVVGEAVTGEAAITLAASLQPDLILMDIKMPGVNGIEATRTILRTSPHIAVLMVTMFDDDESVFAAMRAGARGYLLKDARHDELIRAVTAVSCGEAIFSPAIAQRMIQYFKHSHTNNLAAIFPELTEREREILMLLARGDTNEAIANRLHLSLKTIRNHVSNMLNKLQVSDRAQAIVKARDAGLGS
ncbi:response regulator transcription factor [Candidatus Chloroploca sp. M-50]|uniref:Response regulator transcription factor n=1 Tax=Candidatus Chloroploca mongolica TaxID=2528176 RepID=A0ABS4DCS4_9CHLR|nr:response regulator transcription factor [Candidatus Chloroploca mongolica]MBP1467250.1 response regulator transcription factor [Candidatus Chloroploca mongolica]